MITTEWLVALSSVIGACLGGGATAIINAVSNKRKVDADADSSKETLNQQREQIHNELLKYFTEKLQKMNDETTERFNKLQAENEELRKELAAMNRKLTELNRWIMVDNAAYRTWLENELKKRDPDIEFPNCPPPPEDFRYHTNMTFEQDDLVPGEDEDGDVDIDVDIFD